MSASRFGMKLANQGREVTDIMRDGVVTGSTNNQGVQGGATAMQFERKFDARSPYDDVMNTKMQLMDDKGMTPFGQVYYDDKTGRWLEKKEAAVEAANFDSYFNANFNKNDLASRQWAQSIHPEFYTSREQEMTKKAEVILKLKKIQLRGPQDDDDLYMLYLIDTGRVTLPQEWDRLAPAADKPSENNSTLFKDGLVRFPRFRNLTQRKSAAEGNGQSGAWGKPANATNAFGGNLDGTNKPFSRSGAQGVTQKSKFVNFLE